MMEEDFKMVRKYGKVFGVFDGMQPNLIVTDAELIRNIFIKDSNIFLNHLNLQDPEDKRFRSVRKMVFFLRNKEWKDVRLSITKAFSPSNIKLMSPQMKEAIDMAVLKLRTLCEKEGKFEAKRFCTGLTFGILARCAFGIQIDSLCNSDDIVTDHASMIYTDAKQSPSFLLPVLFPKWFNGDRIFLTPAWKFLIDMLDRAILQRSQSNNKYNDFLENVHQNICQFNVETNGKPRWSQEEVLELTCGQALEVLTDGYEGPSMNLAQTIYSLALHPDVQQKLHSQVVDQIGKFGEISHQMIVNMPYAEQVLKEALRLYPLLPRIDRECSRDIQYGHVLIRKGMKVTFPVYVIHRSEEFYDDPHTFNPDRWSPENIDKIDINTFLPFGLGPRGCLGIRFGMEQMKMALCSLVQQFEFFPVGNTLENMQYRNGFISMISQPVSTTVGVRLR